MRQIKISGKPGIQILNIDADPAVGDAVALYKGINNLFGVIHRDRESDSLIAA